MSDPVIEALRAAVASGQQTKPRKGGLQRWMRKRQAEIAGLLADGISWEQFAEEMNRQGVTNDHGGPVRAKTAERNWRRVQPHSAAKRKGREAKENPEKEKRRAGHEDG